MNGFSRTFFLAMNSIGMDERDFSFLFRYPEILTDEEIFTVSDFINKHRIVDILYRNNIGDLSIAVKLFEVAVVYEILNKNDILSVIHVDFSRQVLEVFFKDDTIVVNRNLLDFEDKTDIRLLRMKTLNEIMIRYFSRLTYEFYKEFNGRR